MNRCQRGLLGFIPGRPSRAGAMITPVSGAALFPADAVRARERLALLHQAGEEGRNVELVNLRELYGA